MWDSSWLEKLKEKKEIIRLGGGEEKINNQHLKGKLTARERLEYLFDEGTFEEINAFVEPEIDAYGKRKRFLGDGVVTGFGEIDGRMCFASAQDYTVAGGSLGAAHGKKICRIMEKALEMKCPYISLNDSGGARIEEGISGLNEYAGIFRLNTRLSGVVPQISAVLGPCAGGVCYSSAICDFIFMTEKNAQMYITGPSVVKAVIGEDVTVDELGGAVVHSEHSGVAHFVYPDDRACLDGIKKLLSYLPDSSEKSAEVLKYNGEDLSKTIYDIVPDNSRKSYDVREVIDAVFDKGSLFEVHKNFAKNIVVGFARLNGESVGVVANQPAVLGGSLDIDASDKCARFVRFCDSFKIPVITLVDVPAFLPGTKQETGGIIRHGAKMLYAYAEASVPKVTLIMRKAYGGAYIAMNSKSLGADLVYAWPTAEIAVMGASGAVEVIGRREIAAAEDKAAKREELIAEYNERFVNPYAAAGCGVIDEVIAPDETRRRLVSAIKMLKSKSHGEKHGNIPL